MTERAPARYRVGYLLAPQSDDAETDSEADARELAADATARDDRLVLGIWRDGELVAIAHTGRVWE